MLAATVAGVAALVAVAYLKSRSDDPGLTTEIALILTVLLGGLSMQQPALTAGLAVALVALLTARIPLQHFVRSVLTACEVRDALLFAGATLVILPLLPNQALGPYGALNPRSIWIVVIFGDGDQRRGLRPRSRARASFWSPDSRSRIGVRF